MQIDKNLSTAEFNKHGKPQVGIVDETDEISGLVQLFTPQH
jgi:hypothetical protein